ncbi:hypothetical protein WJX84_009980, partial [Apatococcus fuscideae]
PGGRQRPPLHSSQPENADGQHEPASQHSGHVHLLPPCQATRLQVPSNVHSGLGLLMAALCMGATAGVFVERTGWEIPTELVGPLVYWVFVCSVVGYYVVTWATQHLPASQVASFQCLQPFLGTLLAFMVLGEQPSWWDLGAIGILAGLGLVARDGSKKEGKPLTAAPLSLTAPKPMRRANSKGSLTRPSVVLEEPRSYV